MPETKLAIIGGGNMAQALIAGAIDAGLLDPEQILVAEPEPDKRSLLQTWGVQVVSRTDEIPDRLERATQLLLAIKPQTLAQVAEQLGPLRDDRIVITILAGTPSRKVREALGPGARVVRAMPNTAARVGKGMAAVCPGVETGDEAFAVELLQAVGQVIRIDESRMDAFTALAGSGPAYLFYLAEAMARGGRVAGLAPEHADRAARATVVGAAALLDDSDQTPEQLRAAVTSKGGTTEAAIQILGNAGVADAIVHAIVAARDRGAELASS